MTDIHDRVNRPLDRLGEVVASTLHASGWISLTLRNHMLRSFTRATRDGLMATAEILRMSYSASDTLPVTIRVSTGVGYRPALDLMPLLTLVADPDLIPMSEDDGRPSLTVTLSGDDDITRAAAEIVTMIDEHAFAFAERFSDVDAIDRTLQDLARRSPDTDPFYRGMLLKGRLVLLTSAGRQREARTQLATIEPRDRGDRRFQRQLTRWLDAGRTVIPPVEETLALLPSKPVRPRPSLTQARARAALKKEATDSVRAQARGKSVDELAMLLAAAYAQRDIEISSASLASAAATMELQQQPFGRARSALRGLRMLASVGADALSRARGGFAEDPPWLQPPERASFPIDGIPGRKATVTLDPDAADLITRIIAEAPARYGFLVRVDVWFENRGSSLDAYIGENRVGAVQPSDAAAFTAVLRAAAIFAEAPFVRGQITNIAGMPVRLEVPLPAGLS